jgi:hypothetical protein
MGLSIGAYYLKVESTNADTINPYTLTLTDSSQTNLEIESNNTFKMANALEKGSPKKGRIYSLNDKDYFGFHLGNEGVFTVTFTPSSTSADYKITLVDAADNVYDYFTSANGQSKSILFYELPGNYYLRVEPSGDQDPSKTYELNITSTADITGLKQFVSVTLYGPHAEMQPGDTQTLTAKAGYSDASTITVTPDWTSLNPAIATVDGAGFVTAIAEGTTSIVARYGELAAKFDLKVGAPLTVVKQHYGNLILVAGGGIADTNTLKESTQYLSDLVYRRFKSRLFTDADIYYFNPMPWHDLDGDGYGESIVDDSTPTVAKFGQAITQWAKNQSTDGPLYVYLINHGGIDKFDVFPGEIATATQLKTWLDSFQADTGSKVVVVIEACKSGSFVNDLIGGAQDRVVVTSANDLDAYLDLDGRISFTQFLIDGLHGGDSVKSAYLKAKTKLSAIGLPYSEMEPQLGEAPSLLSANTYVGGRFVIAGLYPEIVETSSGKTVAANQAHEFYAVLSDLEGIERVWAVVVPPNYRPPEVSADLEAPQVALPRFDLSDPEKDGRYEGSFAGFQYNGIHRVTFYASNSKGNVAVSPSIEVVVTGGISGVTPGDINNDHVVNLADAILAIKVVAGQAVSSQVYRDADVNGDGKIGMAEAIYIMQKVAGLR